jgi:hypothetical protein
VLINILIVVVVGAICFWAIDKFVRDGRLGNLLKGTSKNSRSFVLVRVCCLTA